eukprot:2270879-Prorocentrum_lima.AAC.1
MSSPALRQTHGDALVVVHAVAAVALAILACTPLARPGVGEACDNLAWLRVRCATEISTYRHDVSGTN